MFNIYHHRSDRSIVCVTRAVGVMPRFLNESWEYEGRASALRTETPIYDSDCAAAAIRRSGYYLYATDCMSAG
jgi:hypothetical protein